VNRDRLSLVAEPDELHAALGRGGLRIVDLSPAQVYRQSHLPGAVHLDYARIVGAKPPIMGLLPEPAQLSALFSQLGITEDTHVIAYDNEGGGRASRFLWTLEAAGHHHYSLLNGGLGAWLQRRLPTSTQIEAVPATSYTVHSNDQVIADKNFILARLRDPETILIDCRSPAEYAGKDRRAQRGGHIPGAVNIEWSRALDPQRNLRFKPREQLEALYREAGVTPDKQVIVYCHTHHRSALSFVVLKSLGQERLRAYPGSWSEWGNDTHTPVEP
jgi:thiosulfate/3-mercaptopyruvate sulfurtransferase